MTTSIKNGKMHKTHFKTIVITGCSCVGKTTLSKILLNKYKDKLSLTYSHTTRSKRNDDCNYIFVDNNEFECSINNNEFIDHSSSYKSNYYGIKYYTIENILNDNKIPLIITNYEGASNFKKKTDCLIINLIPKNIDNVEKRIKELRNENIEDRLKELHNINKIGNIFELNDITDVEDDIYNLIDLFMYKL